MVGVMLLTFLSQLGLQSLAHVGESPRATLYRLTSIDIAPSTHTMGTMEGMHCKDESHHHPLSHHPHDGDCPLCPLLGHLLFTLVSTALFLGVCARLSQRWVYAPPAQAPPRTKRERPPSRAPPLYT